MSLLKLKTNGGSPLKNLVDNMSMVLREGGTEVVSKRHTDQVLSMESMSQGDYQVLLSSANTIAESLRQSYDTLMQGGVVSLGTESLTPSQLEAGVFAAMAAGNPVLYAKEALSRTATSSKGINVFEPEVSGIAGRLDFRTEVSMEAFDEKELAKMMPYSIVYNIQAARQDEFAEAFYGTVVVSPDIGGIDISVDRTTVHNAIKHKLSGEPTNFNQRNLVEAVSDASILADESTALVPYVDPMSSNADKFVASTAVAPYNRVIAGVSVPTAPLKVNTKINLIGVSSHPELVGAGILDHTDAVDSRAYINKLYVELSAGAAAAGVVSFNVARIPRNHFNKSVEGRGREMDMNFRTEILALTPSTLAMNGAAPAELADLIANDYTLYLGFNITGFLDTEFSTVRLIAAPIEFVRMEDPDGVEIDMTAGVGAAILAALADINVIGYDLAANRTNSNRRTRGLLLNNYQVTERFSIPLGAPISIPTPLGLDRDARDLEALITASRIRTTNNAVTTLLNYADTLQAVVKNKRVGQGVPAIEGVGRHVIVPYFEHLDLDIATAINSVRSKDKAEDISAVLVNAIRDIAYRMYRDSQLQPALEASSNGAKKPTLIIGTDSVLVRHLLVQGDTRTFGIQFENSKIVTSMDSRMDGKIILAFSREGNGGTPDPLSFGTHAWIPELTSTVQVTRDGATYAEAMVQPRNRHINNLPIMAVIDVTNLTDVLTDTVPVPMP